MDDGLVHQNSINHAKVSSREVRRFLMLDLALVQISKCRDLGLMFSRSTLPPFPCYCVLCVPLNVWPAVTLKPCVSLRLPDLTISVARATLPFTWRPQHWLRLKHRLRLKQCKPQPVKISRPWRALLIPDVRQQHSRYWWQKLDTCVKSLHLYIDVYTAHWSWY